MTDEAALMLRIGVFALVSAVVYWFISYEALGSVALLTLGLGPGMAGLVMAYMLRERTRAPRGEQLRRFIGAPRDIHGSEESIPSEDVVVIPGPSIWPFVISLGFAIALTGLVFGIWLCLIGGILVAAGMWGWLASVYREYRASRAVVEALRTAEEAGRHR